MTHLRLRSWLFMTFVTALLLIAVAIPPVYLKRTWHRNVFVAVAIPTAWAVYLLTFYLFVHRPLVRSTGVFATGVCCNDSKDSPGTYVALPNKELYSLNEKLQELIRETVSLRAAKEVLASYAEGHALADGPR